MLDHVMYSIELLTTEINEIEGRIKEIYKEIVYLRNNNIDGMEQKYQGKLIYLIEQWTDMLHQIEILKRYYK